MESSIDILLQGLEPKVQVRKLGNPKKMQISLNKQDSNLSLHSKQTKSNKNWRKQNKSVSNSPESKISISSLVE